MPERPRAAGTTQGEIDAGTKPGARGTLIILNRDLFFGVKIGNTLRALGYAVEFVSGSDAFADRIEAADPAPALGIVDMNAGIEWAVIARVTAAGRTPILAFGSHLDVEGRRAAKAAGVTRVLSNGDFHRDMVALVERYARPS